MEEIKVLKVSAQMEEYRKLIEIIRKDMIKAFMVPAYMLRGKMSIKQLHSPQTDLNRG